MAKSHLSSRWPQLLLAALLVLMAAWAFVAGGAVAAPNDSQTPPDAFFVPTDQVIVKFRDVAAPLASAATLDRLADRLSDAAGVRLSLYRPMSGGDYVFKLPQALGRAAIEAVAADLAALPEVEYADPDIIIQAAGNAPLAAGQPWLVAPQVANLSPDDPDFANQWHYRYTPGSEEGINLLPAWDITTGSTDIVVAVIDSGIRNHADLTGRTVPGYDFIASSAVANDGNGRDNDPSDPGDWNTAGQCGPGSVARNSSWHGTHVAGTIGAASDNAAGVAGVNWNARILPVRVLGRCGGSSSDIIDGIRWAAGLPVGGVPANPNPARVINLSLGGENSCGSSWQSAFNDAQAAGVVSVVSAGNSAANAQFFVPANCNNVITVAATTRTGNGAFYTNFGNLVEVSAPGGETIVNVSNGVLSTLNAGTTGPGADSLAYYQGTSMAAPHVSGVAALLLGENPGLTPPQVLSILQATARDFPNQSNCSTSLCGAGIIDAFAALSALTPALDAPNLIAPADGATTADATPTFEWSAVPQADGYALVVATDPAFTAGPIDTLVTDTTFTPLDPLADGTYYWRVNAFEGAEVSDWSEVWSFTVDTDDSCDIPSVPELISPADGTTTASATPTLTWGAAAGATMYELVIDDNANLNSPLLNEVTDQTSYQPGAALPPGQYYWAVRGSNFTETCDVAGDWSEVWSFTIPEPVDEYLLYLPVVMRD